MRLKKVEICGFKSFLDKTKLVFQPGITSIVGPNGCGKSNVVDAVCWVLGEQSAKNLRGGSMEDVIFNGTQDREQVGMAEVSLVLDNSNGDAPPQYAQFSEIMVTRRLYRNGESEYELNKTTCRLRDIYELFMDTGVGTKAYSIIKQGQIERITSAKPEDLRGFIEEAAGISKYKSRKKAAEKKLESTKENLLRLNDILLEIDRQLDSLNRQAKKAQKYKEHKDELRELDLEMASHRMAELKAELEQREESLKSAKEREGAMSNEITARETTLEADRGRLLEFEKEIDDVSIRHFRAQSRSQELENQINMFRSQISNIGDLRGRAETDIKSITDQIRAIETELLQLEETKRSITFEVASTDADLQRVATEVSDARVKIEAARREHQDSLSQKAAAQASINALRQSHEDRKEQLAEIDTRLSEKEIAKNLLIEEREKIRQLSFDFSNVLDDLIKAKEKLQEELTGEAARLSTLRQEYQEKEFLLDSLKDEFQKRLSRFDSLKELEANLEGYNEGVRSIMIERGSKDGIFGLVADVVRTEPKFEKALESVLGDRLQYIIVKSHNEGVEAVDYLKTQAAGRGTFIPIEVNPKKSDPLPEVYNDRVIGNLIDLVKVEPEYSKIVEYLLGDVVVTPTIANSIDVWQSNGHRKTLVTLDGEVLDPFGVLSGGATSGVGILEKKREIRELEQEVARLKGQAEGAQSECLAIEKKISETEIKIEEKKSGYHEREKEILHHEKEIEKYKADSDRINKSMQKHAEEEENLIKEAERCRERIKQIEENMAAKKNDFTQLLETVDKNAAGLKKLEDEIKSTEDMLTAIRIDNATAREKLESTERRSKESIARRDKLMETRREKMGEIAHGAEKVRKIEQDIEDKTKFLSEAHEARMLLDGELGDKKDHYQKVVAAKNESEEALKFIRRELDDLRASMNQLYVSCNECSLKIEHLANDIDEKYAVDIYEFGARLVEDESVRNEKNERRTKLRDSIAKLGEVNLTAITEYEELKQRFDFMSAQKLDLEKSIEDLQSVIKKINKTSRQRYVETFELVNENFTRLFPKIFGGGKARLVLEEAQDVLDAGVEIEAMPPGKKLQKMTLLSGGEKALTAVALVFSLFLVKPSPFCFLDEVDSPLDDVNIDRFNDLVRDLSKTSQFIIITHNKRTMELADMLYGVTMEHKGISKLVSVKLSDNGKEAA